MLFSSDDQPSLGYHFRVDFIFPLPNRTIETKFREVSGMDRTIVMETDSIGENKVPFFAPVFLGRFFKLVFWVVFLS